MQVTPKLYCTIIFYLRMALIFTDFPTGTVSQPVVLLKSVNIRASLTYT